MSEPMVGLIGIVVLVVLIFIRMPVGFALALVGFGGLVVLVGFDSAMANLRIIPHRTATDYQLVVLPLFILMGTLAATSGLTRDLYSSAYSWVGQFRGGLAMSTIMASAGFAAISGSSTAGTAALGKIVEPEMRRYNYDTELVAGSVAAGGTLGALIPPSLGFILYAMLTEQSVGKLFMAGIFPGVLEAIFYIITIGIICRLNPMLGPAGPRTSFITKLGSLRAVWPILILFVVVIGGIYLGIFSPTEAGGVGAFGAFAIGLSLKRLSRKGLFDSLYDAAYLTVMILIIFIGAMIFNGFMAVSQLPFMLADMLAALPVPPLLILVVILLVYIVIGCFFDIISALILTIPIIFPVTAALGFDPIWYGVLMVRMLEIGVITPPLGMNTFALSGAMNVPVGTIYRGIVPFLIADAFHIALLIAIPQISLFLPNMMIGR